MTSETSLILEQLKDAPQPSEALSGQIPLWLKAEAYQAASQEGISTGRYIATCIYKAIYADGLSVNQVQLSSKQYDALNRSYSPAHTVSMRVPLWLKKAVYEEAERHQLTLGKLVFLCVYQAHYLERSNGSDKMPDPITDYPEYPTEQVSLDQNRREEMDRLQQKVDKEKPRLEKDLEKVAELIDQREQYRYYANYLEAQLETKEERIKELYMELDKYKRALAKANENIQEACETGAVIISSDAKAFFVDPEQFKSDDHD